MTLMGLYNRIRRFTSCQTSPLQVCQWQGFDVVIRRRSVDHKNLDWMAASEFWTAFQSAEVSGDAVVLDMGAHIGSFSLLAARHAQCRVFAFEPDAESLKLCKANAALNRLDQLIHTLPFATGGETSTLQLYEANENWGHTTVPAGAAFNHSTGRHVAVQCLSLEDALGETSADQCAFLKFNIEGAEFDMIETANVHVLRRIAVMTGEVHYDLGDRRPGPMVDRLKEADFEVELIPAGEDRAILIARRR
jgi:FkbM family methyltransferase